MQSFATLYHDYSRLVASVAANFPLTPQQQEDVCQDVFLVVWQRQAQLQHEHALASWLSTITRNRCLNELRRRRHTVALEDINEEIIHAQQEASTRRYEPTELWQLEISSKILRSLIAEHRSPLRRQVAQRFYEQGESVASIAESLCLCPNTVLSHLRRFRLIVEKSLLRLLEERGFGVLS